MKNKDAVSDPAPQQNGHTSAEDDEKEQPERELTQTDRINRSLLNSFLQRLDDPNFASQFPKVERINTDGPDPPEERDDEKNDDSNSTSEPNTDR